MCQRNDHISPYLRRPLRTYQQFILETGTRCGANPANADTEMLTYDPMRTASEDDTPHR